MTIDEIDVDRDSKLGRARVKDNEDLQKYYEELDELETGALWTVANDIEPWEPHAFAAPFLWPWEKLREKALRALDLVSPEDSGRRVVYLRNPNRRQISAAVGLLFSGIQVMRPGERAPGHRHGASALRFIMEGSGGYTIVDGHHVDLGARDFVLTPNGTWHDHGVADDGEICLWQDGLDIPLTNALEANWYETHPNDYQVAEYPRNDSAKIFGNIGLLPTKYSWDRPYSPLFRFGWDETYEGLQRAASAGLEDEHDGVILRFSNPHTGGHVMATMGASMQMLRPGEHTKAHRHTGNSMYRIKSPRVLVARSLLAKSSTGRKKGHLLRAFRGHGMSTQTSWQETPACSVSTTSR
ncbi:MAG: cupin domain-containing protein [Acidimicrobiales bacterium]